MHPWTPIVNRGRVALVVIRHGQTAWNLEGRFLGRTDLPLNDAGLEQAQALAPWRGQFVRVVSSPLRRAMQTAQVLHDSPEQIPQLAELDQGELEGRMVAEALLAYPEFFAEWTRDPAAVRVPGGGSLSELRDGAVQALEAVAADVGPGGVVAVASHQLVLASVLATLDGAPLRRWRDYSLPNVGAALLSWSAAGLVLEARRIEP
jgi:broad specificity phosphatase PhoE